MVSGISSLLAAGMLEDRDVYLVFSSARTGRNFWCCWGKTEKSFAPARRLILSRRYIFVAEDYSRKDHLASRTEPRLTTPKMPRAKSRRPRFSDLADGPLLSRHNLLTLRAARRFLRTPYIRSRSSSGHFATDIFPIVYDL